MEKLSGKTALVTGASRGIGRASALALAAAGAQVLVHYGRGAAEAKAVVAEINNTGSRADAVTADLATSDGPHKLAQQVRSIIGDRLDILVANAGVSKAATIEETSVDDFDRLFAVNVRAPFFLVQQLLPIMHEGSSILFVSSLAAHAVVGTIPAYERNSTWGRRNGNVELYQDGCGSRLRVRSANVQTVPPARRPRRRRRVPGLERRSLDYRRQHSRRRRLEALTAMRCAEPIPRTGRERIQSMTFQMIPLQQSITVTTLSVISTKYGKSDVANLTYD